MNSLFQKCIAPFLIGVLITAAGCGGEGSSPSGTEDDTPRSVSIIYTDWSEAIAISYLVKGVLEDKLDYQTKIKLANIDEVFPELASGEYELFLDAWLPSTHRDYMLQYGESVVPVDTVFSRAKAGLVVPAYAPISTIQEVDDYVTEIHGIDSASGVVSNTRKALEKYGLNVSLIPGTEREMVAFMDDAYKRRKPFAITGWQPHKIFSTYELKFLEDPDNIYGKSESIFSIAHKSKIEEDKVLREFLDRFELTERQIRSLIQEVFASPDGEEAGARNWMRKNRLIVSGWTKNLHEFEEKTL